MTSWDEVVTTALLGTERRPLPTDLLPPDDSATPRDPTAVLLDLAVRQRAVSRAAGSLGRCPALPVPSADDRPFAPPAAQELLGRLLHRPVAELLNAWLAAAAARDVRPAPEHWTELAALTAFRPDNDRGLLARVLGPEGRWFVGQNPAWARLAEGLAGVPGAVTAAARAAPPDEAAVRGRPELALEVPAPWPRDLTVAALRVLLAGQLGWRASRYGAAVGARVAVADHVLLQQALDALPDVPERSLPGLRLVREAVQAAADTARTRVDIDRVFDHPADPAPDHEEQEWP